MKCQQTVPRRTAGLTLYTPCRYPARFRIKSRDEVRVPLIEFVCGVHVQSALIDNGGVYQPWIIEEV